MKWLLYIWLVTLPITVLAQVSQRANLWYFGYNAGISFNTATPSSIDNGALKTWEGCASMCDEQGQLLFYTDGSTIWNRQHLPIPGATGLGGDSSTTQAATILPSPGNPMLYYVFSVDFEGRKGGVQYSIIDLNANGGLGAVVSKNRRLVAQTTEKLTVVRHCNKRDYWVVTHGYDNDQFLAFLVTANGISPTPVTSNAGTVDTQNTIRGLGYLKASPDGRYLAQGLWRKNTFDILDFDNTTGQVSDAKTLVSADFSGAYGIEFSPNSRYLYTSSALSGAIYQFDLQSLNVSQLMESRVMLGQFVSNEAFKTGALQMGPDGKIYVAFNKQNFLGVINRPNARGTLAGYSQNGVSLGSRRSGLGLPNMPAYFFKTKPEVACQIVRPDAKDCSKQLLTATTNVEKPIFRWIRDNKVVAVTTDSSYHSTTSGQYAVRVIDSTRCEKDSAQSASFRVELLANGAPPQVAGDSTVCANQKIVALTATGTGIEWFADTTSKQVLGKGSPFDFPIQSISNKKVTAYAIQTTADGCRSAPARFEITVQDIPTLQLANKQVAGCFDGQQSIQIEVPLVDEWTYLWRESGSTNVLSNTALLDVSKPGVYVVKVSSKLLCTASDSISVSSNCAPKLSVPDSFTPNDDGVNDRFEVFGESIDAFEMVVYDRWGTLIFYQSATDLLEAKPHFWDGTYLGKPVGSGGYPYRLRVVSRQSPDLPFVKTGVVTLIR